MGKLTNKNLSHLDLEIIAKGLKRQSDGIIKVKIHAFKKDIVNICKDKYTLKNINIIHSATIDIEGIRFELVVDDKHIHYENTNHACDHSRDDILR